MNKGRYRVIFNKATGVFAAVSELARRHGKSTTSGEYVADVSAISGFFARFSKLAICIALLCNGINVLSAEIVADPHAQQQPTVTHAPNQVTNVQIVAPNNAGVSHNKYNKFDVPVQGAILSNNTGIANTQLGGLVAPNPHLQQSGAASVIINEVTSTNKTILNGYLEVAGQKADVVVSNPNGIRVGNFGFINTQRGVLTTGTPVFGGSGSLDAFRVEQGKITVTQGSKLDGRGSVQTDLIARSVQVNGEIWAQQLNVVAGSNKVNYADLGVTVIEGKGSKPQVAIDVAALGGMYASKINLVGTEHGVGVHNYGEMVAQVDNVQINTTGKVHIGGKTAAAHDVIISATDGIENHIGGAVHAKGNVVMDSQSDIQNMGLVVSDQELSANANTIHNTGRLYGDDIKLAAAQQITNGKSTSGKHPAGVVAAHDSMVLAAAEVSNEDGGLLLTENGTLEIHGADGASSTAAKVRNASAKIDAGGDLVIRTAALDNLNTHYKTTEQAKHEHVVDYIIDGKTYKANQVQVIDDGHYQSLRYTDKENIDEGASANHLLSIVIADGNKSTKNYETRQYVRTTTETVVTESAPGELIARGDMTLSGKVKNDKSIITAAGDIKGALDSLDNIDGKGDVRVHDKGSSTKHSTQKIGFWGGEKNKFFDASPIDREISHTTIDLVSAQHTSHDDTLQAGSSYQDKDADTLRAQMDSQLYNKAAPEKNYLIETDPAFTNLGQFISSDYLLNALGIKDKKHLGDGYYEQKMVMAQVIRLTGQRDLSQGLSTEEQYKGLMDAALAVQGQLGLHAGVALTAEQQKALTDDIVWMVSKTIRLPDGKTTEVLSPVVYLAHDKAQAAPTTTAMITANNIGLHVRDKVANSGLVAANNQVVLTSGKDIENTYGGIHSRGDDGQVRLDAQGHIHNTSADISGANVDLNAGQDMTVTTLTTASTGLNGSNASLERAGRIVGGNVQLHAGQDIVTHAANIEAGGAMALDAKGRIELGAVKAIQELNLVANADNHDKQAQEEVNGTQLRAKGDIALHGAQGITTQAANVESEHHLSLVSEGNVVIGDATQSMSSDSKSKRTDSNLLSSHMEKDRKTTAIDTSEGSSLSGDTLEIVSGKDVSIAGSDVVASKDLDIDAKGDIAITTGRNVYTESASHEERTSGVTIEDGSVHIGEEGADNQQDYKQVTHNSSTVGSLVGNVTLKAGKHYGQSGSNVIANKGDVTIAAQKVDIVHATETTDSKQKSSTYKAGVSAGVSSALVSAGMGVYQTGKNYKKTKNARSHVMAALAASGQGYDLSTMGMEQYAFVDKLIEQGSLGDLKALGTNLGVDVGVSVGASKSESHSAQHTSTVKGSAVKAGGDVTITATGDGNNSDVTVIGSDIEAGGNAHLKADNSVDILAGQNTSSSHSYSKSLGGSIGYSAQKGWNGSLSASRGLSDGDAVKQTNSHVKSGGAMNIASGGNTTIAGGVVSGKQVTANVGGDLHIESLQDKSRYDSLQQSAGMEISQNQGGSVNAAQSRANGDYAGVVEQSGIKAGDGGFTVNVKGNTNLVGAVIASTDKAVAEGKNSLTTGTLTTSDIHNHDNQEVDSISGNFNPSGGSGLGVGLVDEKNKHSVTASGISGGVVSITNDQAQRELTGKDAAETIDAINRDVTSDKDGNQKLEQGWTQESLQARQEDAQAQSQIMQVFGQQAAKQIGTVAGTLRKNLEEEIANTTDPVRKQELIERAKKWDEGGVYRVALHTAAGAIAGDLAGALGAGTSAAVMPDIKNRIAQFDLPIEVSGALEQVVAVGLGAAVGGTTGSVTSLNQHANNRMLHDVEKEALSVLKEGKSEEEQQRLTDAMCFIAKCSAGMPDDDPMKASFVASENRGQDYTHEQALFKEYQVQKLRDVQAQLADLMKEQQVVLGETGNRNAYRTETIKLLAIEKQLVQERFELDRNFTYTRFDAAGDFASRNKIGVRADGVLTAAGGAVGATVGAFMSETVVGSFVGVPLTAYSLDYLNAGLTQAWTGNNQSTYGEKMLQSMGFSESSSVLIAAAPGFLVGGAGLLKGHKVYSASKGKGLASPSVLNTASKATTPQSASTATTSVGTKATKGGPKAGTSSSATSGKVQSQTASSGEVTKVYPEGAHHPVKTETIDDAKNIVKTEAKLYLDKNYSVKNEQEMNSLIKILTKDAVVEKVQPLLGGGVREELILKDGSIIQIRSKSKTGGKTIDVINSKGEHEMKVHIGFKPSKRRKK